MWLQLADNTLLNLNNITSIEPTGIALPNSYIFLDSKEYAKHIRECILEGWQYIVFEQVALYILDHKEDNKAYFSSVAYTISLRDNADDEAEIILLDSDYKQIGFLEHDDITYENLSDLINENYSYDIYVDGKIIKTEIKKRIMTGLEIA